MGRASGHNPFELVARDLFQQQPDLKTEIWGGEEEG